MRMRIIHRIMNPALAHLHLIKSVPYLTSVSPSPPHSLTIRISNNDNQKSDKGGGRKK